MIEMNILVLVFPPRTQTSRLQSGIITSQFFETKIKLRLCKLSNYQTVVAILSVFIILKRF